MASSPPAESSLTVEIETQSQNIENDRKTPVFDTVIIKSEIEDPELEPEDPDPQSTTETNELIVPELISDEQAIQINNASINKNDTAQSCEVQCKIEPVDPALNSGELNMVTIKIEKEDVPEASSPERMEIKINPSLYPNEEIQPKIEDGFTISNNRYNCNFCSRNFARIGNIMNHVKQHMANVSNHQCYICFESFKNQKLRDQHLVSHGEEKPFKCEKCRKTFRRESHLKNHENKKCCTAYGDLTCQFCGQIFPYPYLYRSHLVKHDTEKRFSCDICKMNFKHRSAVTRHMLLHTGVKKFECHLCDKKFYLNGLLKTHLKRHSNERPFACPICTKTFSLKHTLKKHLVIHTRPKKLTCDVCQKQFPTESRLKYHMQVHSREKKFSCDICKRFFSHKHNVVRHLVNRHTEIMNKDFVDSLKY